MLTISWRKESARPLRAELMRAASSMPRPTRWCHVSQETDSRTFIDLLNNENIKGVTRLDQEVFRPGDSRRLSNAHGAPYTRVPVEALPCPPSQPKSRAGS